MMKYKLKKDISISPSMISLVILVIYYIAQGFFNIFNSISMFGLFVFIYLFSSSLATIIFYTLYRNIGIVEKFVNIIYSVVIIMFTVNTVGFVLESDSFNQSAVNGLLIVSLILMGVIYMILSFFNTGFPRWFRKFSVIIGLLMIGGALICMVTPSWGTPLLILFLSTTMIVRSFLEELI